MTDEELVEALIEEAVWQQNDATDWTRIAALKAEVLRRMQRGKKNAD